jgi:hypothetical protein
MAILMIITRDRIYVEDAISGVEMDMGGRRDVSREGRAHL